MNLTLTQLVLLGGVALVALGVAGTVVSLAVRNIRRLYRATAAAPDPRAARIAMLVGGVGGAVVGLGVLGYIAMAFVTRH